MGNMEREMQGMEKRMDPVGHRFEGMERNMDK